MPTNPAPATAGHSPDPIVAPLPVESSPPPPAVDAQYAPAALRDQFLIALDGGDWQVSMRLALGFTTCANPLPGMTCRQLDLPGGSTYGSAARRVLDICRSTGLIPALAGDGLLAPVERSAAVGTPAGNA